MPKNLSAAVRAALAVLIIYMASAMIVSPTSCMDAAARALNICAEVVIPSLFPFIFCGNMFIALGAARVLSRTLTRLMKPLFGVSGSGALAVILGVVSGYPVGASCAAELYRTGECTKTEAERLLAFCNNSGPMFIIGAIGVGMLGNHRLGIFLYITHILSALLCGLIFKGFGRDSALPLLPPSHGESNIKTAAPDIGAAVVKSVNTMLSICGFIIIFAVFTSALPSGGFQKYIYALLEITGGIRELVSSGSGGLILPLTAMFTAFSGVSVLAQVMAIILPEGLSPVTYILGKLTQGAIAFTLTYLAVRLTPAAEDVFVPLPISPIITASPHRLLGMTIVTLACSAIAIAATAAVAKIFDHYSK